MLPLAHCLRGGCSTADRIGEGELAGRTVLVEECQGAEVDDGVVGFVVVELYCVIRA